MDRIFDRAFNRAHGVVAASVGMEQRDKPEQQQQQHSKLSEATAMTAEDAIEKIASAFKEGDFFRLLQLPGPQLNELGKATWSVSSSELSKAYRKLTILVHPDKNAGSAAPEAFERLKQAYNELKDPDRLAARLRTAEPGLLKAAERAAAAASMTERIEMNAAAEQRKAKIRQKEAQKFQEEIQEQMRRRQAGVVSKRQRAESSQYLKRTRSEQHPSYGGVPSNRSSREGHQQCTGSLKNKAEATSEKSSREGQPHSTSSSDEYVQPLAKKKRKQRNFM
eukprot:gene2880-3171_t